MAFPSKSNVVSLISNNSISFEASSLTCGGLLLDRLDFHNLFLDVLAEEGIDDFLLFDGDGETEDIDDIVNFSGLD